MRVQKLNDNSRAQGIMHLCSFPKTSSKLADLILGCYARPTPWMNFRSEEHFRREIRHTYAFLKYCCEEGHEGNFFSELARVIRQVILVDLLGTSADVYKACEVILNCGGYSVRNH